MSTSSNDLFHHLFVLEIANNHLGSVDRAVSIIDAFIPLVKKYNIHCAMKLQFRDASSFVHKDHASKKDNYIIQRALETAMSAREYLVLIDYIRKNNILTMSTPFDEHSVKICLQANVDIIKIASSDIADAPLIHEVLNAKKPVIFSTGGANLQEVDTLAESLQNHQLPFAINHCVSIYPTESKHMELNQIELLKNRYPSIPIGLSTHEYSHLAGSSSLLLSYAKGATTFERHIDINTDGVTPNAYSALPKHMEEWFVAFNEATLLLGGDSSKARAIHLEEKKRIESAYRGYYASRNLSAGHCISQDDVSLAIPLQKNQLSYKEVVVGKTLLKNIAKDEPITLDNLNASLSHEEKNNIQNRGL